LEVSTVSRSNHDISRRRFLKSAGALVAAAQIAPAGLLGARAPSARLNVACVGVGGRGRASVNACRDHNVIALCDVDDRRAAGAYKDYAKAKKFRDFRKMLDKHDKEIDAVTVGTPDHTHSVIAMDAIKRGKHVYCEKPLAHSIHEVRALMKAARERKVVTQLGNQGHSSGDIRKFCEWIWDGAIGKVSEVHVFCDAFKNVYCQIDKLPELEKKHEVPEGLDYDLWLGPAQHIDYSPLWVPWNWRGWMPFGTGCIGDWFCHVVDPSFWAFDLGSPTKVHAEVLGDYDPVRHALVYPRGVQVRYEFPARTTPAGDRGPITMTWFDGDARPPRPKDLEKGKGIPGTGGVIYGDKGTIVHGSHGAGGVRIIPDSKMKAYKQPAEKIRRVRGHHEDWLDSIRDGKQAGSNFDYGGALTELGLLGMIAIRFAGTTLEYDGKKGRITNNAKANALVTPKFRKGWTL
jgi:predicted dehydrogenase